MRQVITALSVLALAACNDVSRVAGPVSADTAGFAARMRQAIASGARFDIDANGQNVNTNIYVEAGSILTFEVESVSNGWCDQVYLGGVLSGTRFSSVGPSWCGTPEPVTIGPIAQSGMYTVTTEISRSGRGSSAALTDQRAWNSSAKAHTGFPLRTAAVWISTTS